jgi:presenilin-like A22 family membrane protease
VQKNLENIKREEIKDVVPSIFLMGSLFVIIDALALLTVGPYEASGVAAFSNPNDPMDIVYLFLTLLGFTFAFLLIARFWKKQLILAIVLMSVGLTVFTMVSIFWATLFPAEWSLFLSITTVVILLIILVTYPEWYVVDTCCVIVGAGVIAILGISLNVFLVIVLLIGLAIYDAISVYLTKHMIDLADTLLDLKLPVILAIPRTRNYSLIGEKKSLKAKLKDNEKREAFFIGLGDIIMPGTLVASTFHNVPINGLPVALSVMFGTILGLIVLMRTAIKGKPQAGLPFLCGGAILGYLLSSYILFGTLSGLFLTRRLSYSYLEYFTERL